MKRFRRYKIIPTEKPQKDWADIAYGWPLFLLPLVAMAGMMFSRLIISNSYYIFCLVFSCLTTCYFLAAGIIRYNNKRTPQLNSYNPYVLLGMGLLFFYAMSYIAFAHGITLLFNSIAHEKHHITATVTGTQSGGRYGCPALQSSELHTFFGKALCVSNQTKNSVEKGDKFMVIGRKSIFGVYVDQIGIER